VICSVSQQSQRDESGGRSTMSGSSTTERTARAPRRRPPPTACSREIAVAAANLASAVPFHADAGRDAGDVGEHQFNVRQRRRGRA